MTEKATTESGSRTEGGTAEEKIVPALTVYAEQGGLWETLV
jgi:hypothetical protein